MDTNNRPGHLLHTLPTRPTLSRARHRSLKKNAVPLPWLMSLLFLFLAACSAGSSPASAQPKTSVPTVRPLSPTPTSLPAGTVLYQADWSHGLTGGNEQGWKIVQGQLESSPGGTATFTIPYRPAVSAYAIEIRVQLLRTVPPYGGYYQIVVPASAGKDGYHAGILDLKRPGPRPFGDHPQSQVYLDPFSDMPPGSGIPQDYEPGSGWHTYRVEVRGNQARLLDDGTQIGSASSQQANALSNGPIAFSCARVILRVGGLRILSL